MTKRAYRQHCAVARALDVVGERWTLLLVRELLTGSLRYGELLENLRGIGTNLLAARLKDLGAAGIVAHDDGVYRLTERGRELEPAVLALARFGASLLGERRPGDVWRASWNVVALKYAFRPERAPRARGVIEFRTDDDVVQARLRDGTIETVGEAAWPSDVVVTSDGETLLELASGDLDPSDATADGRLEVTGDRRLFRTAMRAFALS